MQTRREWLKLTGAGLFTTLAGCASSQAADAPAAGGLGAVATRNGAKGWALWDGHSKVASWHTDERSGSLSITKTLAGLAVTKAVSQGKMSLDEPAYHTLTEWKGDAAKQQITPRMLLQQVSGLENGGNALYRPVVQDKGKAALSLKVVNQPGTFFRYGASHWEVLAEYLNRRLGGGNALEKHLSRNVLNSIGLESPEWRSDLKGRFYLSTGTKFTVEDLGRLGRTLAKLLRGENADGFDAGVFANVTRPSNANPMFGGGLWRNVQVRRGGAHGIEVEDSIEPAPAGGFWPGACLSTRNPADLVGLIGSSGQRVFIWPSRNRVFARLGGSRTWKDRPLLETLA
ncbi:beta-lactamase family protein [Luteolibacter ambystomatis]|uniref:Beta-lactamase family protein n=1 Tax=Luteolibacter ambystomatis TaxID=2824561 RepID=A0A975G9P0_9BACT|nr:serine hydrolase domain-containing protein [Luteolibacter ambystomatis]QUE51381.1 beta-lactamase family protein [Luteolibacter ambystomatis]